MTLEHVNVKLFVDGTLQCDLTRVIEVFHGWVANQSMPEMMIDVADYRHLHHGPGVVMVGLAEDYSLDHRGGAWGLLYNRKAACDGSNADRFAHALKSASAACLRLEADVADLRFDRSRFELFVNDRALAPNSEKTRVPFAAELAAFVRESLGDESAEIDLDDDRRARLGGLVRLSQPLALERFSAG